MRRNRRFVFLRACAIRKLLRSGGIFLILGNEAVFHHARQHGILALFRVIFIAANRRIRGRCRQQPDKHRALRYIKLIRRRIKIRFRSLFDAERILAEIHRIQIHRQNLIFRVILLYGNRHKELLVFTEITMLVAQQSIFYKLLRQRRAAARSRYQCAQNTQRIKTAVLIKILILAGNQRFFHTVRNIRERHIAAVFRPPYAIKRFTVRILQHNAGVVAVHQPLWVFYIVRKHNVGDNRHDNQKRKNRQYDKQRFFLRRQPAPPRHKLAKLAWRCPLWTAVRRLLPP